MTSSNERLYSGMEKRHVFLCQLDPDQVRSQILWLSHPADLNCPPPPDSTC